MKKLFLTLVVLFAIITINAQTYLKYEYMKVLPGQDYEKLEKSWVNVKNCFLKIISNKYICLMFIFNCDKDASQIQI